MAAAAFFDLDRTLLRRSSALALAGTFRQRGLISRRQLAKAAAWQLLFVLRGASHEAVRRAAEDGLVLLRGFTPEEMRDARRRRDGAGAAAARLRGAAPSRRAAPRARRAGVHRLGDAAGDRRGDRRRARLRRRARHGVRGARRRVHRARRARAARGEQGELRARARRASTASTSPSAPRTPTATPTCRSSRRSAIRSPSIPTASCGASPRERGWPVLEFGARLSARAAARSAAAFWAAGALFGAGVAPQAGAPWRLTRRSAACGRSASREDDAETLWRALRRRGGARQARARLLAHRVARDARGRPGGPAGAGRGGGRASSAGTGAARSATSCSTRSCARSSRDPPEHARARRLRADVPDRDARRLGAAARRGRARRGPDGDVAARGSGRRGGPKVAGTNPLAIGIPSSDGEPVVVDVSMGAVTWGDVVAGLRRRSSSSRSAASSRTRRSRSRSGCSSSSTRCARTPGYGAVLLVARPESRSGAGAARARGRRAAARATVNRRKARARRGSRRRFVVASWAASLEPLVSRRLRRGRCAERCLASCRCVPRSTPGCRAGPGCRGTSR